VTVNQHPGRRCTGHPVTAEDEHGGRGAHAGADRQLGERHHRYQYGDCIEERGVDADRMQHSPVTGNLREHGRQYEADHAASAAQAAEDREAPPQLPALPESEMAEAGAGR
jgi:hypothetical protein